MPITPSASALSTTYAAICVRTGSHFSNSHQRQHYHSALRKCPSNEHTERDRVKTIQRSQQKSLAMSFG
ncbi:unnamed protein product [Chondrus crispus]|uniref:Uncharacterized protein n=1 Tax=Chondrus crispus TaxID=2769 RepID=R7QJG1_CHOCR|nr:unnamed protein product [Chondrus crispus]CDF38239.1 unnamed protein product [Chondrus crispus]|eukprot:XP_005718124.1 unnamed protein product [Chondrus crispus]